MLEPLMTTLQNLSELNAALAARCMPFFPFDVLVEEDDQQTLFFRERKGQSLQATFGVTHAIVQLPCRVRAALNATTGALKVAYVETLLENLSTQLSARYQFGKLGARALTVTVEPNFLAEVCEAITHRPMTLIVEPGE